MLLSKIFSNKQTWNVTSDRIRSDEKFSHENYHVVLEQDDRLNQCVCMIEKEGDMCSCTLVQGMRITGRTASTHVCSLKYRWQVVALDVSVIIFTRFSVLIVKEEYH